MDVGAGNPELLRTLNQEHFDLTHVDKVSRPNVLPGDILHLPQRDGSWEAVLAKRVLCCLPPEKQLQAASELARVVAPNGRLFVCDVHEGPRVLLNKAREGLGLPQLPGPKHNHLLTERVINHLTDRLGERPQCTPVAANYVIWTRLYLPALLGHDDPFERVWLRACYPAFPGEVQSDFGFHRVWCWRKVNY